MNCRAGNARSKDGLRLLERSGDCWRVRVVGYLETYATTRDEALSRLAGWR